MTAKEVNLPAFFSTAESTFLTEKSSMKYATKMLSTCFLGITVFNDAQSNLEGVEYKTFFVF